MLYIYIYICIYIYIYIHIYHIYIYIAGCHQDIYIYNTIIYNKISTSLYYIQYNNKIIKE